MKALKALKYLNQKKKKTKLQAPTLVKFTPSGFAISKILKKEKSAIKPQSSFSHFVETIQSANDLLVLTSYVKSAFAEVAQGIADSKRERAQIACQMAELKGHCFFDTRLPKEEDPEWGLFCVCDDEYPADLAFQFLAQLRVRLNTRFESGSKINQKFLDELLKEGQDPALWDKLFKIQKTLDETKAVMYDNIQEVLNRGEKIESLQLKTELLYTHSGQFERIARRHNRCCKAF